MAKNQHSPTENSLKKSDFFDIQNWLWKYDFGTFWQTAITRRIFLKIFPWWHVDSWPKTLLFRTHHLQNSTTELTLLQKPWQWILFFQIIICHLYFCVFLTHDSQFYFWWPFCILSPHPISECWTNALVSTWGRAGRLHFKKSNLRSLE